MKTDWFRVIVEIERSGMSHVEIGARIGRSSGQVQNYKSIPDTEPRHSVGELLLALWRERCSVKPALAKRVIEL